jgi:hypothetical protein
MRYFLTRKLSLRVANSGSAGCPVLPAPHHLLSNVRHDVAIAGTIKLLHGQPVT